MLTPLVAERPAQPYVAIRAQVTMQTLDAILLPLQPQVLAWLREREILPAGRYATVRYTGHPDGVIDAITSLREWAEQEGLTWAMTEHPEDGERWAARLEIFETDPAVEPDMTKWTTQLAFRLAG